MAVIFEDEEKFCEVHKVRIVPPEKVNAIIQNMDTEFDRMCTKAIVALNHYRREIERSGLRVDTAKKALYRVIETVEECKNAQLAAEDMVKLRWKKSVDDLTTKIQSIATKIEQGERSNWPDYRLSDLKDDLKVMEESLQQKQQDLLGIESENRKSLDKFRQAIKRTAAALIEDNRIKSRKLGAGAPMKMDEEDEIILEKCIEEKASAHGRRHDTVLYTGHRVRKRDPLRIVSYSRARTGLQLIKSCDTAYTRSKPRNARSVQGKQHNFEANSHPKRKVVSTPTLITKEHAAKMHKWMQQSLQILNSTSTTDLMIRLLLSQARPKAFATHMPRASCKRLIQEKHRPFPSMTFTKVP